MNFEIGIFSLGEVVPDPVTGTRPDSRQRLRDIIEQCPVNTHRMKRGFQMGANDAQLGPFTVDAVRPSRFLPSTNRTLKKQLNKLVGFQTYLASIGEQNGKEYKKLTKDIEAYDDRLAFVRTIADEPPADGRIEHSYPAPVVIRTKPVEDIYDVRAVEGLGRGLARPCRVVLPLDAVTDGAGVVGADGDGRAIGGEAASGFLCGVEEAVGRFG
jgi:hypothetical protein